MERSFEVPAGAAGPDPDTEGKESAGNLKGF